MQGLIPYTLNIRGHLLDLSEPQVMGILNVTPDSFYAASRKQQDEDICQHANAMLSEGADIIDIGACSTRPGSEAISAQEEMDRLARALDLVRERHPHAVLSIDTYRADIARRCVEDYGADIINDISGGDMDPEMYPTVASLGVPYVLMHMKGTPETMQAKAQYTHLMAEILEHLALRVNRLHELGQKDIIIDPGFGFAKTLEQNYQLLNHLEDLKVLELPILVGLSRKSMIYRLLGNTPDEALHGTVALNTIALQKGAHILRVHDVKACRQTIEVVRKCLQSA